MADLGSVELYPADSGKTYWHETEARRLMIKAQDALYDLHRYMETALIREDWREIYSLRCQLGPIERRLKASWEYTQQRIREQAELTDGED